MTIHVASTRGPSEYPRVSAGGCWEERGWGDDDKRRKCGGGEGKCEKRIEMKFDPGGSASESQLTGSPATVSVDNEHSLENIATPG